MRRRTFLQAVGVGTASGLAGCGSEPSYKTLELDVETVRRTQTGWRVSFGLVFETNITASDGAFQDVRLTLYDRQRTRVTEVAVGTLANDATRTSVTLCPNRFPAVLSPTALGACNHGEIDGRVWRNEPESGWELFEQPCGVRSLPDDLEMPGGTPSETTHPTDRETASPSGASTGCQERVTTPTHTPYR